MCDALAEAHSHRVLHRDLKPSNVMLADGIADYANTKVVDFGIAKVIDHGSIPSLTATGDALGSPEYMSPEQCQGLKVDERTDIYSMGCLMFETLCGRPPFRGDNPLETLMMHINNAPPNLMDVNQVLKGSADLVAIVNKTLAKDPRDRFTSMRELKDALDQFASGSKVKIKRSYRISSKMLIALGLGLCTAITAASLISAILPQPKKQTVSLSIEAVHDATLGPDRKLFHNSTHRNPKFNFALVTEEAKQFGDAELEDLCHRNNPWVRLWLPDSQITDKGLLTIRNHAPNVMQLIACRTHFTDAGMEQLQSRPFEELDLRENENLTGHFLQTLNPEQLNLLNLSQTSFNDQAAAALVRFKKLNVLKLAGTRITDVALTGIGELPVLEQLNLSSTGITDRGLPALSNLKKLDQLNLSDTQVSDRGIAVVAELPKLKHLNLKECKNVSKNMLAQLAANHPGLQVETDGK
jgi:serine/threonine protein kinase